MSEMKSAMTSRSTLSFDNSSSSIESTTSVISSSLSSGLLRSSSSSASRSGPGTPSGYPTCSHWITERKKLAAEAAAEEGVNATSPVSRLRGQRCHFRHPQFSQFTRRSRNEGSAGSEVVAGVGDLQDRSNVLLKVRLRFWLTLPLLDYLLALIRRRGEESTQHGLRCRRCGQCCAGWR